MTSFVLGISISARPPPEGGYLLPLSPHPFFFSFANKWVPFCMSRTDRIFLNNARYQKIYSFIFFFFSQLFVRLFLSSRVLVCLCLLLSCIQWHYWCVVFLLGPCKDSTYWALPQVLSNYIIIIFFHSPFSHRSYLSRNQERVSFERYISRFN